jgi:hypothetical protein
MFPSMFNTFCQSINIVLTKDDICTLVDVVIVDPTQVNLLFQSYATPRFVTSNATQAQKKNYCDSHPIDQFFPLATKVFECLHK